MQLLAENPTLRPYKFKYQKEHEKNRNTWKHTKKCKVNIKCGRNQPKWLVKIQNNTKLVKNMVSDNRGNRAHDKIITC